MSLLYSRLGELFKPLVNAWAHKASTGIIWVGGWGYVCEATSIGREKSMDVLSERRMYVTNIAVIRCLDRKSYSRWPLG